MSRSYQRSDAHIVDYELFEIPGVQGAFRGPKPAAGEYVASIGASQTFGRFVQEPYSHLVARGLDMEVLNLGRGGIGPEYLLHEPTLMRKINRARLVVVQVLSGRSQSNSLFEIARHGMCGVNLTNGREQRADEFYAWLQGQDLHLAQKIVAETRNNYVASMTRLLDAITPPKVLLWFSERSPDCVDQWNLPKWRLCGKFPQFVNREMINHVIGHADRYLEFVSTRGMPQPLFDRNGNPASFMGAKGVLKTANDYYPSPQMHEDAAKLLIPACRDLLHQQTAGLVPRGQVTSFPIPAPQGTSD